MCTLVEHFLSVPLSTFTPLYLKGKYCTFYYKWHLFDSLLLYKLRFLNTKRNKTYDIIKYDVEDVLKQSGVDRKLIHNNFDNHFT